VEALAAARLGTFLDEAAVVRQRLAGIAVVVDQAMAQSVGLVKPDRGLVVHPDVPEGIDRVVGIMWDGANTAVEPRLGHFIAKVGTSTDALALPRPMLKKEGRRCSP